MFDELSFTTRKATMQNLDNIIIADKVPEERKAFIMKWYKEHEDRIIPRLGSPANQNHL